MRGPGIRRLAVTEGKPSFSQRSGFPCAPPPPPSP